MKRLLALIVLASPFSLSACGHSYDSYRSKERHAYADEDYSTGKDDADGERSHARARPGWSVTESSDVQGGYGPGSYGGHSSTVITPRDDGSVQIDGESSGR